MYRFIASGTIALLSFATAVSALTFNPTQDNRQTYVGTVVLGSFTDGTTENPSSPFDTFDSNIFASSDYDGLFANAWASQFSQIGSMYIQGSGFAQAQIGFTFDAWEVSDTDTHNGMTGEFSAGSQSIIDIVFSIDMDAHYDLSGFIGAGIGQTRGDISYGSEQSTSLVLFDIDNGVAIVDESVTDGEQDVSTSGDLAPGTYRFTVDANANVYGADKSEADTNGIAVLQDDVYTVEAGFEGVSLLLSGRDNPIPEPVTTTLAGLGLGALALQTSRRRRA